MRGKITPKLAFIQAVGEVCRMEGGGKLYYGIKEVAELFGINASKLRFYEKEFPTLQPKKNRSGDRVYTPADIEHLREILDLTQNKGYTLPGAREYLKTRDAARRENARYIAKLKQIKTFLEQIRDGL
ncbi:MerR family transcriptional regulator [Spirosoma montaniterrae]|nr:MerR family transcriptional regulator [Spirosoma montaniterrae]